MSKLNIVKVIPIYAKVLHSELILSNFLLYLFQSFLCLHNVYTVKPVASRETIIEINMKTSMM